MPLVEFDYESIACIEDGQSVDPEGVRKMFDEFKDAIEEYSEKAEVDYPLSSLVKDIADDNDYNEQKRKML